MVAPSYLDLLPGHLDTNRAASLYSSTASSPSTLFADLSQ